MCIGFCGNRWLSSGVLYLPLEKGGQRLIHVAARMRTMRLWTAQKLLFLEGSGPLGLFGLGHLVDWATINSFF